MRLKQDVVQLSYMHMYVITDTAYIYIYDMIYVYIIYDICSIPFLVSCSLLSLLLYVKIISSYHKLDIPMIYHCPVQITSTCISYYIHVDISNKCIHIYISIQKVFYTNI